MFLLQQKRNKSKNKSNLYSRTTQKQYIHTQFRKIKEKIHD